VVEPSSSHADHPAAFVADVLSRAERRAMVTGSSQPAADLAVTRLSTGSMIFLGIRHGELLELADQP
jgi:hypothetical protein